ncbi:MAG: transglutaminase-like domain-containing protein [Phycisphaerae bacterium]|jgi:hypothetical protein
MIRWMPAVASVVLTVAAHAQTVTRWYSVELFGAKAGSLRQDEERTGDTVVSRSNLAFELNRGAVKVSLSMSSEFVETAAGKPVSMRSVQNLAMMPVTQEYTFGESDVKIVTLQGQQRSERTVPRPKGDWLTPAAADRFATQRFKSGAKEISYSTIDPLNGLSPVTTTRTVGEKTKIRVLGREIEATSCSSSVSSAPGIKSTELVDDQGVLVSTTTQMGGISMILRLCTEEEATLPAGGAKIPDAFTGTFITPDRTIANARTLDRGVYLMSVSEGELESPPETGSQRFERLSPSSGRLTVTAREFSPAPEKEIADPAWLASTTMCPLEDPEVVSLAKKAVAKLAEGATAMERAEACRGYVHRFIRKKTLGVGFASASEVCRTREGDCSEHGVLLCALLRANGIPARVTSGLVYADAFAGAQHIFGYHMWTQALIEIGGVKRWVDLDATLSPGPYDATHICLGVSSLADDNLTTSMASMATSMGRLSIKVMEPAGGEPLAPVKVERP